MWTAAEPAAAASPSLPAKSPRRAAGLVASPEGNYNSVSWNPVPGIGNYNLYRSTTPSGEGATPFVLNVTSYNGSNYYYNDYNITAGTTYYYQVTALDGVGESAKSNEGLATAGGALLAAPKLIGTATAGASNTAKNVLNWGAIAGATSYTLYRASDGQPYRVFKLGLTATTYTDTGLTNGKTYSYIVVAVNAAGSGNGSNALALTPGGAIPPAPTGLVAQTYNGNIALTWNASPGVSSYNIYRGASAGGEGAAPIAANVTGGAYPFPNPSYIDSGLTSGTTYYYFITANNGNGESGKSGEVSATDGVALLAAPSMTVALNGSNQAVVSWSAVTGATSYNVYRNAAGQGFTRRVNVTTLTYTDTGVSSGLTYTYYVCAVDTDGQGNGSNQATVTPGQPAPPAPTGLTAGEYYYNNSQVALTWNPVPGASSYNVYEGTAHGAEGATPVLTGVTNPNNVVVGNLTTGTTYYFVVSALNAAGESGKSNEATATPNAPILAAPRLTAAIASSTEIDLSWSAVVGAASYNVYRSIGATGTYTLAQSGNTGTTFHDTGLTAGLIYAYYVVPVDADGSGSGSNAVSVALGSAAPPAPTGIFAFPYNTSNLTNVIVWNAVPGASSYNVYRGTTAGGEGSVPIVTGTNNGYTGPNDRYYYDANTVAGTTYYYKVTAVNSYGESAKSTEAAVTTEASPLAAPVLTYTSFSTSIALRWSAVTNATSYTVLRTDAMGYRSTLVTTTATSYTDNTAVRGVTYAYFVFANSALGSGNNSNTVHAAVNQKTLSAPTGLTASPTNTAAYLYWNAVPGAASYNVYVGTGAGGEGTVPYQTGVGAPNYNSADYVSGLTNGTKYYFVVTAVTPGGESAKSNEASALAGGALLAAPTLTVTGGSAQATLNWSSVSGATSYLVFRAVGSSLGTATFLKSVTGTTTADTGLTNGLNYTYSVIPVGASGQGNASNTVTVLIGGVVPPAPGGLAAYWLGYDQIIWSPVPGITSYNVYRSTTPGGEGITPYATNVSSVSGAVFYYNDSGVTSGTTYYYKITAVNSVGESAKSSEVSVLAGTAQIAAPSLTASNPSGTIVLNWTAVTGATSYNIYWNYAGQGFLRRAFVSSTTTTYTDTAVGSGIPVSYYVTAVSAAGQGANSNTVSLTAGGSSLSAPTGLAGTNDSNANIYLTWNPSPGASSYNLYRGTQSGHEAALPIIFGIGTNSYTDANVVPGVGYYYQVTALNGYGESGKSNEASVVDATTTVAAPTLTGKVSGTSVVLSWNAVSGATGYNVYRNIVGAGYTLITSVTATTATDAGLTSGLSYSYYVTTVNSAGQSGGSNTVAETVGTTATLPAPSGLVVFQSNGLTLIWAGVPGASSYNVYRGTTRNGEGATPIAVNVTQTYNSSDHQGYYIFTDGNVTSGTTYYYFVTAVNGSGESGHSNQASGTYGVSSLPAPSLSATASSGKIALTWSSVPGASTYNLYRNAGGTSGFTLYQTGLTTTTYTDSSVTSGIAYSYYVNAVNTDNQGLNSNTVSLFATGSVLPAPFGLVAGPSGASAIYIQWNFVAGASSYNVYRGTTAGGEAATPIATGVTYGQNNGFGNFTDSTANVNGQTYYYRVTAVNGTGESAKSTEASATVGGSPLSAPSLTAVAGTGQVVLTWSAVPGATTYTLYRNAAGTGFITYKTGLGTTYTDTGVTNGLTYQYYVAAVNVHDQGYGSNTATVTLNSTSQLPAPTGLYIQVNGASNAYVVWNFVPGASSYNVYRGTTAGGEAATPIATGITSQYSGPDRIYFYDGNLSTGTTYYYKVTAVNSNGESAKSAEASVQPGASAPGSPALSAVPASGYVSLTWSAVPGATSYDLFRTDPTNSNYYLMIVSGTGLSYTDSTVTNGISYSYSVNSVNANGIGGGSNTVTVTPGLGSDSPLPAPELVAQAVNNGVTLSWTNVTGATSYIVYRATTSGGENGAPIAANIGVTAGGTTSYTDATAANYTTYYYKVAAQNGYGTGKQSNEASATPPTTGTPDFLLSANPGGIAIASGDEDTVTIGTLFVNNLGTPVSLTVSGVPANVTATFDPPVAGSGGSYLDIAAGAGATLGTYTLTVTGTSGSITHTTTVTLQVLAAGIQRGDGPLGPAVGRHRSSHRPAGQRSARKPAQRHRPSQSASVAGQIQGWKNDLHAGRVGLDRAAQLHLWLGEYALAHSEQPEQALAQFRAARRTLPTGPARLKTLASYDSAFALFYMGAYAQSRDAFHALLATKTPQPGLDAQTATLWWRHSLACANYHTVRAALGIPEPPRLDPKCGIAALAACLRQLNQPYAEPLLLASCRVTGEGSHFSDLMTAAPKLGVTMRLVTADDRGLALLPKPVIAYVEHDHFIAVTKADATGVSYLCSDCGAWPGGRVDLTWAQWHKLEATDYGIVTVPNSNWDRKIQAMEAYRQNLASGRLLQVASTNFAQFLPSVEVMTLALHIHPNAVGGGGGSQGCGQTPDSPKCPPGVCCPESGGGSGGGGPEGGDPANLATGEEEYTPSPDITVYNPYGPQVTWSRIYGSLRSSAESAYEYTDFGCRLVPDLQRGRLRPEPRSNGHEVRLLPERLAPVVHRARRSHGDDDRRAMHAAKRRRDAGRVGLSGESVQLSLHRHLPGSHEVGDDRLGRLSLLLLAAGQDRGPQRQRDRVQLSRACQRQLPAPAIHHGSVAWDETADDQARQRWDGQHRLRQRRVRPEHLLSQRLLCELRRAQRLPARPSGSQPRLADRRHLLAEQAGSLDARLRAGDQPGRRGEGRVSGLDHRPVADRHGDGDFPSGLRSGERLADQQRGRQRQHDDVLVRECQRPARQRGQLHPCQHLQRLQSTGKELHGRL